MAAFVSSGLVFLNFLFSNYGQERDRRRDRQTDRQSAMHNAIY